jgi:hypothetical protein
MPSHRQYPVNTPVIIDTNMLLTESDNDGSKKTFFLTRAPSISGFSERSTTPTRFVTPSKSHQVRSVSFDKCSVTVHKFYQSIDDETKVWYNASDYKKFRLENQKAIDQTKRTTNPLISTSVQTSLRGLEKYNEAGAVIAMESVLRNQHAQNPLVLAARYSKFSKPSLEAAIQRARGDEAAAFSGTLNRQKSSMVSRSISCDSRSKRNSSRDFDRSPAIPFRRSSRAVADHATKDISPVAPRRKLSRTGA